MRNLDKLTPEQERLIALQKAVDDETNYLKTDMPTHEFIDEYCYIENKDNPGNPIIKFKLWESQKTALQEMVDNKLSIILKARQLGFTWLVLCLICHLSIKFEGYTAIVLSDTEEHSKDLIKRVDLILSHLPKWLIYTLDDIKEHERQNGKGTYTGLYYTMTSLSIEIRQAGRVTSVIKAQPSTEGAGRSLTADLVFFDEWSRHNFASDVFDAAYPTMSRPGSGKFIGLSTNKRGSFFESVWKNAASKGFHKIFRNCFADPRRTPEWYEETKAAMGSKVQQEFPTTEEEALISGDNVSFPEWSESIHVCDPFPIPAHWRRFGGVDNGYNDPFYWGKMAVSEDGIVYLYYEYSRWRDEPQLTYSDQARVFNSSLVVMDGDKPVKEKIDYIVAGKDAWNKNHRDTSGKCLIDYYRDGGVSSGFIPAVTDQKLRKATFHEYLRPYMDENTGKLTAKFQVFSTCTYFIETISQLVNDDDNPEIVADLSDINNPYDACLAGDTLIDTVDGQIPIRELVGKSGKVHCFNEETGDGVIGSFNNVRCTARNADIYEVALLDGRKFKATSNHPVLTETGWKTVGELTEEDCIIDISEESRRRTNHAKSNTFARKPDCVRRAHIHP